MTLEELKASAIRMGEEVWNKGKVDLLDEYYTPDSVLHQPPFPDVQGIEIFKHQVKDTRTAFPDFRLTIDDVIAEGNKVAVRWTVTGTHTGPSEFIPVPPTGKQVSITGSYMARVEDGKFAEIWFFADNLGQFQQLGIIPEMEGQAG